MDGPLVLAGGEVLTPEGLVGADLVVVDGAIASVGDGVVDDAVRVDVAGRWVLPGIVDLHGDAVERALSPRPGAPMPVDAALVENDRAMLAAGITTAYLSLTDGFEPGLRSRQRLREVIGSWRRSSDRLGVDTLVHVRHERCNVDDLGELLGWMADGTVTMLSLNDHAPAAGDPLEGAVANVRSRVALSWDEAVAVVEAAVAARPEGLEQEPELVAAANAAGVPIASHDDADPAAVRHSAGLGVRIAEFPYTLEAAATARELGIAVLLGAPNLVRGGSHLGNLSVADAIAAGVVDVLASDYHYPALLAGTVHAVERGITDLPTAWSLVSAGPARAAGLDDRGELVAGRRADVVVIDPTAPVPAPELVLVGGEPAFSFRRGRSAVVAAAPR